MTQDHTRQWTAGVAYVLHWRDTVDFAAGLEPVRYERTITEPQAVPVTQQESPLLYYASAAVPVTAHASAYAALTRGPQPYSVEQLQQLADRCTQQEDNAAKVERQVAKSAAAMLVQTAVGQVFDAVVTGAAPKGTWVRVMTPPCWPWPVSNVW